MFGEIANLAASSATNRVNGLQATLRNSSVTVRSREGGDVASSNAAANGRSGLLQSRNDPADSKAKAEDGRHGRRLQTDSTEDGLPRPKVKFNSSRREGQGPISGEEGREPVEPLFVIVDEGRSLRSTSPVNLGRDSDDLGRYVDVYA